MKLKERYSNLNSSHLQALHYIWKHQYISRIELSQLMKLNKSSITRIVDELQQLGTIIEEPKEMASKIGVAEHNGAARQRGRPSVALRIDSNLGLTYGVELRLDSYQFVILQPDGYLHRAQRRSLSSAERKLEFAQRLELVLKEVKAMAQAEELPVLGIGIGLSGIVNSAAQKLLISEVYGVEQPLDLQATVEHLVLGCSVHFCNDARCCAAWERKQSQSSNFVVILGELYKDTQLYCGNSPIQVGLGFVLGGEVYMGANFSAGEFQSIFKAQQNCTQFNLKASEEARLLQDNVLLHKVFEELCANIAFLVDTLDLEEVRFAGNIVHYAQPLSRYMEQAIERQWSHVGTHKIPLYFSEYGELSVAMGAAATMQQKYFTPN